MARTIARVIGSVALLALIAAGAGATGLLFYGIAVCPDLMCNRP